MVCVLSFRCSKKTFVRSSLMKKQSHFSIICLSILPPQLLSWESQMAIGYYRQSPFTEI